MRASERDFSSNRDLRVRGFHSGAGCVEILARRTGFQSSQNFTCSLYALAAHFALARAPRRLAFSHRPALSLRLRWPGEALRIARGRSAAAFSSAAPQRPPPRLPPLPPAPAGCPPAALRPGALAAERPMPRARLARERSAVRCRWRRVGQSDRQPRLDRPPSTRSSIRRPPTSAATCTSVASTWPETRISLEGSRLPASDGHSNQPEADGHPQTCCCRFHESSFRSMARADLCTCRMKSSVPRGAAAAKSGTFLRCDRRRWRAKKMRIEGRMVK